MIFPQRTMPEALAEVAAQGDSQRGYTFVSEEGESFYSFEDLALQASRYAAAMRRAGARPGDRVALALPTNDEFVFTMLGAMHAGLVPVPMYPPTSLGRLGSYLEHAQYILQASESAMLITSSQVKQVVGSLIGRAVKRIYTVRELGVDTSEAPMAPLQTKDPAFIQFTSGSTSRPKGVVLTHGNLSVNTHCIMNLGLQVTPDDIGCAWLPLYHDMGLIGFIFAPITTATPVVLMSPLHFLKRPIEWLRLITRHRASIGFSPNFGYGLCASRIREQELDSLDLSSWRIAGCGAEPIQMATLSRFAQKFERAGFDRKAFLLCYGLAESTLAVSFSPLPAPPQSEEIRLDEFTSQSIAQLVDDSKEVASVTVANCGSPFAGHEIAIVDTKGKPCPPRHVGEIVLRGPSLMQEYDNNPAATHDIMQDGWLHTGDLGYLSDGDLFVCGRIKELIIAGGRNYHPADVEWALSDVPGIRPGRAVAFSVLPEQGEDVERVVICLEAKGKPEQNEALIKAIKARVLEALGIRVNDVVLLKRRSLPRTSSGKLQRNKTREMYLNHTLATAADNDGKLILLRHLLGSQWGLLRSRMALLVTGAPRR
ncbi:fatty acyl-AMP ligase [Candidatus Entotheonella palauensis]|uniref:fatty acyl-AMP ligase n=1 Tax=Candidatus Entotheonella palauensis TaxID=93172 RepID=UPI000B7FFE78|nr:fatty acyl-AMP ligase [Candidatus Entotheonella palauensis]